MYSEADLRKAYNAESEGWVGFDFWFENFKKKQDMKQETLEEAAENYAKQMWGVYYDDVHPDIAITQTQGDITVKDFIAGAKWQSKRAYTLEQIQKDFLGYNENGTSSEGWFDLFLNFRLGTDIYPSESTPKSDYIHWRDSVVDRKKITFIEWFENFKNIVMENKKQTAIEKLIETIDLIYTRKEKFPGNSTIKQLFDKVKELENSQAERMYSETELEVAFFEGRENNLSFTEWFEKFKNK